MKIRTVVRQKVPHKSRFKDKKNTYIFILLLISESVLNTFLPFISGFYFGLTQRLFWLIPFILLIVFNLHIDYDDNGNINIKIMRTL